MTLPAPNHYTILNVSPRASSQEIRTAYQHASLRWHPDRVAPNSPDHRYRANHLAQLSEAYLTLSDTSRQRDYDAGRPSKPHETRSFWGSRVKTDEDRHREAWDSALEALVCRAGLAETQEGGGVKPNQQFWAIAMSHQGGGMAFLMSNMSGAMVGAGCGGKLGSIRDKRGVCAVFEALPAADRANVLNVLASRLGV